MISQRRTLRASKRPRIIRKQYRPCASTRDNASYFRHSRTTTTIATTWFSLFESYVLLLAIIFEVLLLTIIEVIQLILIFLRYTQNVLDCDRNRLWGRLCYHRRTFENQTNQSHLIGLFGDNEDDVIPTPRNQIEAVNACLHDDISATLGYDWTTPPNIEVTRLTSRRFDKLRSSSGLRSYLYRKFVNCGGKTPRTVVTRTA